MFLYQTLAIITNAVEFDWGSCLWIYIFTSKDKHQIHTLKLNSNFAPSDRCITKDRHNFWVHGVKNKVPLTFSYLTLSWATLPLLVQDVHPILLPVHPKQRVPKEREEVKGGCQVKMQMREGRTGVRILVECKKWHSLSLPEGETRVQRQWKIISM